MPDDGRRPVWLSACSLVVLLTVSPGWSFQKGSTQPECLTHPRSYLLWPGFPLQQDTARTTAAAGTLQPQANFHRHQLVVLNRVWENPFSHLVGLLTRSLLSLNHGSANDGPKAESSPHLIFKQSLLEHSLTLLWILSMATSSPCQAELKSCNSILVASKIESIHYSGPLQEKICQLLY